ncbi:hypothetical protein Gpo141_00013271, partial [Globisporangium polare]
MQGSTALLLSPISPYSTTAYFRTSVLIGTLVVYIVFYPLGLAFPVHEYQCGRWIETVVEILFFVDFVLMFNTSFEKEGGEIVTSRIEIASHYVRSWFFLDLLSSMPVYFLFVE